MGFLPQCSSIRDISTVNQDGNVVPDAVQVGVWYGSPQLHRHIRRVFSLVEL